MIQVGAVRAAIIPLTVIALAQPAVASAASRGIGIAYGRIFAALLLCALLALAAALLLRRYMARSPISFARILSHREGRPQSVLSIVESRRMSVHGDVCLIQWDNQEFLVACGPGGLLLLAQKARIHTDAKSADVDEQ